MIAELPIQSFSRGLQLLQREGDAEPGAAIDLSDVWFPVQDRVATRDGYVEMLAADAAGPIHSIAEHRTASGTRRILVGHGTGGRAYDTAGAVHGAALTGMSNGAPWSYVRMGTPALERTFIANGIEPLRAYDETSGWSIPALTGSAGVGTGKHVAIFQERLVNANFTGTGDDRNPSAIRHSDIANPTTFSTNAYNRISPGDGEGIMGLCAWRDWLYAPKETKIAVYYGNSDNAAGDPVFNFEIVDSDIGMAGHGACCPGRTACTSSATTASTASPGSTRRSRCPVRSTRSSSRRAGCRFSTSSAATAPSTTPTATRCGWPGTTSACTSR